MDINLKETLRSLRKQKNVTQSVLAEYLGIAPQSVGKWERGEGYPDITLLPKIAMYFNVSIDDLLDVGKARIQKKINEYKEQSVIFEQNGDIEARLALWEKAYAEFPNDFYVIDRLSDAILCAASLPYPKDVAERIISLSSRILNESADTGFRTSAIFNLCIVYKFLGDTDKALYYADMCTGMFYCKESMRAFVLQGEEGIKESQSCLLHHIFSAAQEAMKLSDKDPMQEIPALQFSIDIMKLLFSDGNFGKFSFQMSYYYLILASAYARKKDTDKTFDALDECVKFCIMDAQIKNGYYTVPILNRLNYGNNFSKNFKGNACNARIKELASWIPFNYLRDHPRFKKIEDTLKQYADEYDAS